MRATGVANNRKALLSAVPTLDELDRLRIRLDGEIPSAADPPTGCRSIPAPRKLGEICETTEPELTEAEPGHGIRCHIPLAELRRLQTAERDRAPTPAGACGSTLSAARLPPGRLSPR